MTHTDMERVLIEKFDEAKDEVWTDDDLFTMGYNNGMEAGKNIALALLKEHEESEPHVLQRDEIRYGQCVYVEWRHEGDTGYCERTKSNDKIEQTNMTVFGNGSFMLLSWADINKRWRAWTSKPSTQQRLEVAWDG